MGKWASRRSRNFECFSTRNDHPWRTDSGYSIPARYLVDGLCKDLDLGVFAPVGQRYKIEYYFPEVGIFSVDPTYKLVLPDKTEIDAGPPVPIYPGVSEDYGENIVEEHYQHFQAELLWLIGDAWALSRIFDLAKQDRIRLVLQPPVDFMEPFPQYLLDRLSTAFKIVPWVQDGYDRLAKAGLKNLADPIPLGINTDLWKPRDRTKFPDTMRDLGFGLDTFNIAIVAANQMGRKAWEQTFRAIRIVREQRPDIPMRLYIHTHSNIADGWDMTALLNHYGIADITNQPDPYSIITGQFSEYQIMLIHALADVIVNAGLEGFGHSTIQAQAVGTPVIGLNAAATPELVKSGILVPVYSDLLTPALLHKVEPHPMHIADALIKIRETPRKEFAKGVQFVKERFDWPIVLEKWRKLFREVDAEFERRCIKSVRYPPKPSERALELAKQVTIVE